MSIYFTACPHYEDYDIIKNANRPFRDLIIFEYVKKGVRFEDDCCSYSCSFMNYSRSCYCRLFCDALLLMIKKDGSTVVLRLKICKELFEKK